MKKVCSTYLDRRPYSIHPSAQLIFGRMAVYQISAMSTLAVKGILSQEHLQQSQISFDLSFASEELLQQCSLKNLAEKDLVEVFTTLDVDYHLLGKDGLKHRTSLMEYRNDPV